MEDLQKINEVVETWNIEEVNKKMQSGWVLIKAYMPNHSTGKIVFSLGRV